MPSEKGDSTGREEADFPDTTMNLDQQCRTEDTRAGEEVSLNTKASLGNDAQYTGEADRLQPLCLIKTSTTSSIGADTVAALGGNKKAKSFIESVAERFASQYSDQLEEQLQDACGNPKRENEPAHHSREMTGIPDDGSHLVYDLHRHKRPRLTSERDEEEGSSKGKIVESTTKEGDSNKKDSKHLEDYLERDWPNHPEKDFHAETKVQVDSRLESDHDTVPWHGDRDSIASEGYNSAESRAGSTDSASSILSASDMKVVLRKLDEIESNEHSGRVVVPYDCLARLVENCELLPARHGKWALTLRRIFKSDNKTLKYCWLDIESRLILDVLERIPLSQESGLRSTGSIYWPDDDIFRYREDIRTYALEYDELAVKHVNVLLQLVEEEYATRIKDLKTLLPNGSCNFEILREVFWKDDLVITKCKTRAYRLVDAKVIGEPPLPDKIDRRYLNINAVYVDF